MSKFKDAIDSVIKKRDAGNDKGKRNFGAIGSALGLIGILLVASIATGGRTVQWGNMENVLRQVTILGVASLGMTVVILTGNIDLSIIGIVTVANVLTAKLMQNEMSTILIILIVLAVGSTIGLVNALILNKWKIESFVVTMGMQVVCFGLGLWISDSRTVIVDFNLLATKYGVLKNLATGNFLGIPVMFLIMILFYVLMYFFSIRTKLGRYIFALGGNEEVCYMSGVNVNEVRASAYIMSGFFAAMAGIFMYSRSLCGDPTAGNALGMYVVAAVVVGGTKMSGGRGNILFTIIGIFIIQFINNTMNLLHAPYQMQQVIQGIVILLAVILSSDKRRDK